MKVCVRYCGGCNPCIDRVGVVEKLSRLADDIEISRDSDSTGWCLVIDGCRVGCKGNDMDPADDRVLHVAGCSVQGEEVEEEQIPAALLKRIRDRNAQ